MSGKLLLNPWLATCMDPLCQRVLLQRIIFLVRLPMPSFERIVLNHGGVRAFFALFIGVLLRPQTGLVIARILSLAWVLRVLTVIYTMQRQARVTRLRLAMT